MTTIQTPASIPDALEATVLAMVPAEPFRNAALAFGGVVVPLYSWPAARFLVARTSPDWF